MTPSNGRVPHSIWESTILRDALLKFIENLVERYARTLRFSLTVRGAILELVFSPTGTTVALTYKDPDECQSPDLEPSKDQSTVTGTPLENFPLA